MYIRSSIGDMNKVTNGPWLFFLDTVIPALYLPYKRCKGCGAVPVIGESQRIFLRYVSPVTQQLIALKLIKVRAS